MQRKVRRKFKRELTVSNVNDNEDFFTMSEMFERFMQIKNSEGLARRTIKEYYVNYEYFLQYTGGGLKQEEMTMELFMAGILLIKTIIINFPL